MNKTEIIDFAIQLIETADAAYLTTVDNGVPYTRAMENLRNAKEFPSLTNIFSNHEDDLLIYFSTNTSSEKVKQIKKNHAVAVYYCKPKEYLGVMLGGLIEIVTDQKAKEKLWVEGWETYYLKGVKDQDYTILRLFTKQIRGWNWNKSFKLELD